jgi:predicted ATPase
VREPAEWPDGTVTAGYGFLHDLYHEVLYHRIPSGRRRLYHARIWTRLARGFGQDTDAIAAELACILSVPIKHLKPCSIYCKWV